MPGLRLPIAALLLASCCAAGAAPPQAPAHPRFEHLSVEEGLSQVSVLSMIQDREGFLWIGTQDGLNRYDGYGFTVYRPEPGNAESLSGNFIHALYEDAAGTLWVGTNAGLSRFDRRTEAFQRYDLAPPDSAGSYGNYVAALAEGPRGKLWAGTPEGGLYRLDNPAAGTFTRFRHDPQDSTSLPSNAVHTLYQGAGGTLWVGTRAGLSRFQPGDGTFAHVLRGQGVSAVAQEAPGTLWLGTYDRATYAGALVRYDLQAGQARAYPPLGADYQASITAIETALETTPACKGAESMSSENPGGGRLWIGTAGQGLRLFDPEEETFARYTAQPEDPESLSGEHVTAVVEGRFGGLWVGTEKAGLNHFDRQASTFAVYRHRPGSAESLSESSIYGVYEDQGGALWVGTIGGGLNRVDRKAGTVARYLPDPGDPESLSSGFVSALAEDEAGRLWVGGARGLDRFDRESGTFTHYPIGATDSTRGAQVLAIRSAPGGAFWLGTANGLYRFDPERGAVAAHYPAGDPAGLSGRYVFDIDEDARGGRLWVATESGLDLLDPATGTVLRRFRHDADDPASLGSNYVVAVHRGAGGMLWVATFGGGLNRLDPEAPGEGFTRYTEQSSGLPSNTLAGLLEDDAGHLWISTYAGLAQFDPATETFRTYGPDRGVQSTEFNNGAYHKSADGELFFGGVNGLNAFFPENVDRNARPPEVVLTRAALHARGAGSAGRHALRLYAPEDGARVQMAHDQNDFSFEYVGLHYAAPERNAYAYQLDGYDDDWQDAGTGRQALYTNLDPGDYTFRVKAANRDGVWSASEDLLAFTIRPPWWTTWWAYGGYALVLGLAVAAVDRFQRRRLVRRERAKAALREAELKAEIAEREGARQTHELEEARQLQLSMLPREVPALPQADLAACMRTATEVGGDYYDFRLLESGALLLAIGDATGHGARAGTMVTAAKTLFNSLAGEQRHLAQALSEATRVLRRLGMERLYMALALARLEGNRLTLAGAGLPPALVWRAARGTVEEVSLKGMPLGGVAGYPYRQHALRLAPADVVVLMSDGFPEAFDADGRMIGYDCAAGVLREVAAAGHGAQAIIERFEETARAHAGLHPQGDDMTFVALKMRGGVEKA